jgi:integrase
MATIKFRLQSKKEISNIYVRVRDGKNTDIETPTGFTTNPNLWSETKGEPLQKANNPDKLNLKVQLERLKTKIIESLNTDKGSGTPINKEWLIDVIAKFKNPLLEQKTEYLKDLIKAYQTEMKTKINPKTGKPISHLTIKSFSTTLMRLKKFEEYKNKRFSISDVDLTFKNDFVKYESEKLLISQNSISKDIRQIKTVCLDASDKGFSISEQVRSRKFYIKEEQTAFVTITENEIELIKKCDLKKVNYLENARDWLIIGCWTGCRVSDLMQLTNANIQIHVSGQKFIRYTQSKTNKQVDIPIHSDVNEILERLGNFPRPISDQRFNEWIKKVCFESGLVQEIHGSRQNPETHRKELGTFKKWELVRSHTCRRSFATNHYNKLPNKLIMAVTGHATEKMLLNYIGETENDHLEDFLSVWNTPKVTDENIIRLNKKQA